MLVLRVFVRLLVCTAASLLVACAPNPEQIGQRVMTSMQETFSTDPNFTKYEIKVMKVVVVKETGNKYQGMATLVTKKGAQKQVPVQVTAEGENVIWRTEPGALLFIAQDELSDLLRQ